MARTTWDPLKPPENVQSPLEVQTPVQPSTLPAVASPLTPLPTNTNIASSPTPSAERSAADIVKMTPVERAAAGIQPSAYAKAKADQYAVEHPSEAQSKADLAYKTNPNVDQPYFGAGIKAAGSMPAIAPLPFSGSHRGDTNKRTAAALIVEDPTQSNEAKAKAAKEKADADAVVAAKAKAAKDAAAATAAANAAQQAGFWAQYEINKKIREGTWM